MSAENPPKSPSTAPAETAEPSGAAARPPAPALTGAQKRHLRGLAHPLRPIVHVGEAGLSEAVTRALNEALDAHELVKVRLRQPQNKKEAAAQLAESSASALCGVVGHTVVLYRPHPETPEISLPS